MLSASKEYKEQMKRPLRNRSYMWISVGLINLEAQANAQVSSDSEMCYLASPEKAFSEYEFQKAYATCEENFAKVDGNMLFPPRESGFVQFTQGIISKEINGPLNIEFPVAADIKGLTIDFGDNMPEDFWIISDHNSLHITGNDESEYVTDEVFLGATFIRIEPEVMYYGQNRLRIRHMLFGVGLLFDNTSIESAERSEEVSPIMESLPEVDFSATINNRNAIYSVENPSSFINFMETGQEVTSVYGRLLDDGTKELIRGGTMYLTDWNADGKSLKLKATDIFDTMDGDFYLGTLNESGVSLYELAETVLQDAGFTKEEYWLDNYLKTVSVQNPVPICKHKEALQMIANAGRCILYQDRNKKIVMKSSFIPDIAIESSSATSYSNLQNVLMEGVKEKYANAARDFTAANGRQYFIPKHGSYLDNMGYTSEAVSDGDGLFSINPTIKLVLENTFKFFGMQILFGESVPEEFVLHSFLGETEVQTMNISNMEQKFVTQEEFKECDSIVIEIVKTKPFSRVCMDYVSLGAATDYCLTYGNELCKKPNATKLGKVKMLKMNRTSYTKNQEAEELLKESILLPAGSSEYIFTFEEPVCELQVECREADAVIAESASFYIKIQFSGLQKETEVEIVVTGKKYLKTNSDYLLQLNDIGKTEEWSNPLISSINLAKEVGEWIGAYMKSDVEYNLEYRGEPRLEANDLCCLESPYVSDMEIRVHKCSLSYKQSLSGKIEARRVVNVG